MRIDPIHRDVAERRVRRHGGQGHPWMATLPWMTGHQISRTVCGPDTRAVRGGPVPARIGKVANEGRCVEVAERRDSAERGPQVPGSR